MANETQGTQRKGLHFNGILISWGIVIFVLALVFNAGAAVWRVNQLSHRMTVIEEKVSDSEMMIGRHETKFGHESMGTRVTVTEGQTKYLVGRVKDLSEIQIRMGKDTAVLKKEIEFIQHSSGP